MCGGNKEKNNLPDYITNQTFNLVYQKRQTMKLLSAFLTAGVYAQEAATGTETGTVDPCSLEASTLSCEANKMMLEVPYCAITAAGFAHGSVFMGGDDEDNQNDSCAGYGLFCR